MIQELHVLYCMYTESNRCLMFKNLLSTCLILCIHSLYVQVSNVVQYQCFIIMSRDYQLVPLLSIQYVVILYVMYTVVRHLCQLNNEYDFAKLILLPRIPWPDAIIITLHFISTKMIINFSV